MSIGVGDPAPDFTLLAHDGRQISLGQFRGQKNLLLVFYVRDDTPG